MQKQNGSHVKLFIAAARHKLHIERDGTSGILLPAASLPPNTGFLPD